MTLLKWWGYFAAVVTLCGCAGGESAASTSDLVDTSSLSPLDKNTDGGVDWDKCKDPDQGNDKPKKHDCPRITCSWKRIPHVGPGTVLTLFEPNVPITRIDARTVRLDSQAVRNASPGGYDLYLMNDPVYDPTIYTGHIAFSYFGGPQGPSVFVSVTIVDEVATLDAFSGHTRPYPFPFPGGAYDDFISCTKGRTDVIPAAP